MRPACIHGLVDHCARCPITDPRDDNEPPPWQAWPGAQAFTPRGIDITDRACVCRSDEHEGCCDLHLTETNENQESDQ
jgi:hypothetical protein